MKGIKLDSRFVFGLCIVGVGLLLLLGNLDVINFDFSIGTFWPIILIVIGLTKVVNYGESTFWGFILLLVGIYFQLQNLNVDFIRNISLGSLIWPTVVILIGLSMLMDRDEKHRDEKHNRTEHYGEHDETKYYSATSHTVEVEEDVDDLD